MTTTEADDMIETIFKNSSGEDEIFTGFQLKDILLENKTIEDITKALLELAETFKTKSWKKSANLPVLEAEEEESEEDKKKRLEEEKKKKEDPGMPKYEVEQLLTEMGYKENIEKYKENQIEDEEFWAMVADSYETHLEIMKYGQRFLLEERVKEIKAKHAENYMKKLKALKMGKKATKSSDRVVCNISLLN